MTGADLAHSALLRTPDEWSRTRMRDCVDGAQARGEQVVTVAAPAALRDVAGARDAPDLDPVELRARPADAVARALDGGHRGLGVLVWADGVIDGASAEVHGAVETVLTDLCRVHPVSVLCVYDRDGGGRAHPHLSVGRHPGGVAEAQAHLRRAGEVLRLEGEFDTSNADVLGAALREATAAAPERVRVDLAGVGFLSAAAARTLAVETAGYRADGGRIEVRDATGHPRRVLRMLRSSGARGLDLPGL